MRPKTLAVAGVSVLACFAWARPSAVWQPADATRVRTLSAVADFNRDGSLDSVRSDRTVVSIALSRLQSSTVELTHTTPVVGLFAADVDHDGDTDVLTLTRAGRLRIWRNDGRGHFSAEIVVPRGLFDCHLPAVLELARGDDIDPPGEGPGHKYRQSGLAGTAAASAPIRAGPGYTAASPFASHTRGSRSAPPRAPPTRVTA